jgi:5-methylcytosine-specific restriction enzyme A
MSRQFSKEVKRLAWKHCSGHCEGCTAKLAAGGFIYDHVIPWAMTQDSSLGNCQVLCLTCDDLKTPRDQSEIADAKRVSDFHHGISGPGLGRCPMRGGKKSRHSKTFHHGTIERVTGNQAHWRVMAKLHGGFA